MMYEKFIIRNFQIGLPIIGGDEGLMKKINANTGKTLKVAIIVVLSVLIVAPLIYGDVMISGNIQVVAVQKVPVIEINNTTNVSYKGGTFQWMPGNSTYSINNYTLNGTLRVHVNFNVSNTIYFWNILELNNTGNLSGHFNVSISKVARIGNYTLNSSYTDTISVWMDHNWQTTSNPGVQLLNNTIEGPFALYPSNQVSYYIGVIYTEPQNLPSYVQQNLNALGEYITFSFYITL